MIDKSDILQVTLSIKSHLFRLMSEQDARKLEADLDILLDRYRSEASIEDLIFARLMEQDNVRKWLESAFQLDADSGALSKGLDSVIGYDSLIGDPRPVNALRYMCPMVECGFDYYVNRAGRPIPPCPFHNVSLKPVGD